MNRVISAPELASVCRTTLPLVNSERSCANAPGYTTSPVEH